MPTFDTALVWFRRDLRDFDHAALYHALKQSQRVFCAFIFDKTILQPLLKSGLKADRRVEFIHASLIELDTALRAMGGGLIVRHAEAAVEIPRLAAELGADAVFINHDFEPQAIARDAAIAAALQADGRQLLDFKDHVIFEKDEVLTLSERPFSVFTPYKNAWLKKLHARSDDFYLKPYPTDAYRKHLAPVADCTLPSLEEMGFTPSNLRTLDIPTGMSGAQKLLQDFCHAWESTMTLAIFRQLKDRLICRSICVSARFRSARWRAMQQKRYDPMRAARALRHGYRN